MPSIYDRPPTPGQVIQVLILEPYQMTVVTLAKRLGIMVTDLSRLVAGAARMTPALALRLSRLTGTSPNIWTDMQRDVDLWDIRHERNFDAKMEKIEPFPSPLRLRKLITPTADDIEGVQP